MSGPGLQEMSQVLQASGSIKQPALQEFDPLAPLRREGEVVKEELGYHGRKITLFQMEHQETFDSSTGEIVSVPPNWQTELKEVVKKGDKVFLEYFPPELKKIQDIPVIGHFVGIWTRKSGIDVFADAAEVVSQNGADVFVADAASNITYAYQELAVDIPKWREEMLKRPSEERRLYSGHGEDVDPLEIDMQRAIDARRLMTARALMQESLRGGGEIVWVGPEAHGKRIKTYIQRQNDYEAAQNSLTHPEDMAETCPTQEKEKVKNYKHTPGFNNKIRHYSKTEKGWQLISKNNIY